MAEELKAREGDVSEIAAIPAALRERYRTAFEIEPEWLIDAAARRAEVDRPVAVAEPVPGGSRT